MIDLGALPTYSPRAVPSLAEMDAAAEEGRVVRRDDGGCSIFVYSRDVFYSGSEWDDLTRAARGLVYRRDDSRLVALPFPKFFNVGEREEVLPDRLPRGPFRVLDKLDGSLILLFHDGDRWRTSTKGSLTSPQSEWAEDWVRGTIDPRRLDHLRGMTLLLEGIYPRGTFEDDLVVDYGDREELVLLGAYLTGPRQEVRPDGVRAVASSLGLSIPEEFSFDGIKEVLARAESLPLAREGFVVQFLDSGLRVKVKGRRFVEAHKFLTGVSPARYFWGALGGDGRVSEEAMTVVPPDVLDDMLPLVRAVESAERGAMAVVADLASQAALLPEGKARADWVVGLGAPWTAAVFSFLSGGDGRARGVVRRALRPHADGGIPDLGSPEVRNSQDRDGQGRQSRPEKSHVR